MIYGGPGFLAFAPHALPLLAPLSRPQVVFLLSQSSCVSLVEPTDEGDGGRGWAWSQSIRSWESLALYKTFNTLWDPHSRLRCFPRRRESFVADVKLKDGTHSLHPPPPFICLFSIFLFSPVSLSVCFSHHFSISWGYFPSVSHSPYKTVPINKFASPKQQLFSSKERSSKRRIYLLEKVHWIRSRP